jgi:hypothetical protein
MEVQVGWMRVLIEAEEYLKLPPFFSLPISLFFYSKITVLSQNQFLNLKRFFVKCLGKFSLQKVQKKKNHHQIRNRTLHHITNILHASKIRFEICRLKQHRRWDKIGTSNISPDIVPFSASPSSHALSTIFDNGACFVLPFSNHALAPSKAYFPDVMSFQSKVCEIEPPLLTLSSSHPCLPPRHYSRLL